MQTKNALANLKNRYIAVLEKCNLINTFGALAIATMCAMPATAFSADNPEGSTTASMDATDGSRQDPLNQVPALNNPILTNYGNIIGGAKYSTTERTLYSGMFGYEDTDYTFSNNGTISIDYALPSVGTITVSGMYVVGNGNHTLTNNATITVTLTDLRSSGNSINFFEENQAAIGLFVEGTGNHTLTNSGSIVATGIGGTITETFRRNTSPSVAGMYALGNGNHELTNTGSITATARGGEATSTSSDATARAFAYAMFIYGSGNYTLTNSGTITASATAGITSAHTIASSTASAYGMYAYGAGNHTLTNSGTITVSAIGGEASSTSGSTNTDALALGMRVLGVPTAGTFHLLTNTGVINASASVQMVGARARAYEAYGSNSFTVDTWATTLRDWSANDAVFGLANGEILTFANDTKGATLILRPDTVERGFKLGQTYDVAKMVAISDGTPASIMHQQEQFSDTTIKGSIAEVKTEVDFLTATLHNGGTNNPSVSLSLNTDALPTTTITTADLNAKLAHIKGIDEVSKNAVANVYNRAFNLAENELEETAQAENVGVSAGSNTLADIPKWTAFAKTYGSYTDNSKYDYDSGTYGISGGVTHNFNEKFALGGHLDFNASNADSKNLESDSYSFALGAHSYYFVNPNWYVRGNATFAFGSNEVEYNINSGKAEDTFSAFALFAGLHTGYAFEINKNNLIIPEIGLSYLYSHNNAYDLHFSHGYSMYDMDFDTNSYSNLYADFNLTWQANYAVGNSVLSPSLGAGIRQNLTGSDIDSSFDMFGTNFETQVSSDDTTFLANAGLQWTKKNFTVSADYEGEFGSEQTSHTGSLNFTYKF